MSLDIYNIQDGEQSSYSSYCDSSLACRSSFQPQQRPKDMSSSNGSHREEIFYLKDRLRSLEPKALNVLDVISRRSDGVTNRQIRELTGFTSAPARRLVKLCVKNGLVIEKKEASHRNINPTSKFYLNSEIFSRSLIINLLEEYGVTASSVQSDPDSARTDKKSTHRLGNIPSPFEPYFNGIKARFRQGFWEAFLFVAEAGITSAGNLCAQKEWASSVGSSRLSKLIKLGLLDREEEETIRYFPTREAIELCRSSNIQVGNAYNLAISRIESYQSQPAESSESKQLTVPNSPYPEVMSNQTLSDLASAVTLLANEVVKLNRRIESIERKVHEPSPPDFSLEEIKRLFASTRNVVDNSQQ